MSAKQLRGKGTNAPGMEETVPSVMRRLLNSYKSHCLRYNTPPSAAILKTLKNSIAEERVTSEITIDRKIESKPADLFFPWLFAVKHTCYCYVTVLRIYNSPLTHQCVELLNTVIKDGYLKLTEVLFVKTDIDGSKITKLAEALSNLDGIKYLNLDCNKFGDQGSSILATKFQGNTSLSKISLRFCDLTSASGKDLEKLILSTAIVDMNLEGNRLRNEGAFSIISGLVDSEVVENSKQVPKARPRIRRRKKRVVAKVKSIIPWVERLGLANNEIDESLAELGFSAIGLLQKISELLAVSRHLKELDLSDNFVGCCASSQIIVDLKKRPKIKLNKCVVKTTHRISQELYQQIQKANTARAKRTRRR